MNRGWRCSTTPAFTRSSWRAGGSKLVASLIYLRYCKRRYLKFYRAFDRFKMKCFFHQALMFWGYAARQCIIDNTNLARLRGTGANAVIVPEMEAFAKQYGFVFRCHEIKHSNRKAGEERSFWTVETNFLPGRTFQSLEDLNRQALAWSTVRLDNKPQGKAGLIPAKAFEHERSYLTQLPAHLPAPYRDHEPGHRPIRLPGLWRQLLLGAGNQARGRQGLGIRRPVENLPGRPMPGRVSTAARWRQKQPVQSAGTAAAARPPRP